MLSKKIQKIVKNIHHNFSEAKITSSDCLFCLTYSTKPKDSQYNYVKQTKVENPHILRGMKQQTFRIFPL